MNHSRTAEEKKLSPGIPVCLSTEDRANIKRLQKNTKPINGHRITQSEIMRRAIRWAVPKMLKGELPVVEEQAPVYAAEPAASDSEASQPAG